MKKSRSPKNNLLEERLSLIYLILAFTFSINSSSVGAATGRLFTNANDFFRPGPQYDWHPISIFALGSSLFNFGSNVFKFVA